MNEIKETKREKFGRIFGHLKIEILKPLIKIQAFFKKNNKSERKSFYRKKLTEYQKKYLSRYLYVLSDQPQSVKTKLNKTIWFCWLQGEENAPPIIANCLQSIRRYCPDYEVVVLTEKNIKQYTDIPDYIYQKNKNGIITNTQFSDLLRLELLTKNGGIWVDATVFLTEPLPKEITSSDFFSLHADSFVHCNSWLIKANAGNVFLEKLKRLMFSYWQYETKMLDYFLFHIFFDLLAESDEECALIWRKTPVIYDDCYDLEHHYFDVFNEQEWQRIKQKTSIHKLSWKYKKQPEPNTFLANFLNVKLN